MKYNHKETECSEENKARQGDVDWGGLLFYSR